ncbi:ABC transporter ATP-binding protein [Lacticaseibacillus brantae]|uniref:ABC-type uncharacterized transport system, ATPase component n=1 Tax=Lacticaseibacillus brantae DSM 23927 TaxID=1423727 RepID=A0A0R2B073_9LACO|nr:ATP-binding cassette domain-containing protein [Lacticaseibacillus brantae]KRM72178.1 ABC-type uncharacterized transport system, ATPase component [Lacticaseibacillus brantae DSM 23927]
MTVLEVNRLNQVFDAHTPNAYQALDDINLTLDEGDFLVILGGNGAGKTTLLNSIAGTLPVVSGQIKVRDHDITNDDVAKRAAYMSRVFQDPRQGTAGLLSVEENLAVAYQRGQWRNFWARGVKKRDRDFFKNQLAGLGLGLDNRLNTEIGRLSGGQRQAITLLMATLKQPDLLLLDEHTAALDPATSQTVMALTDHLVQSQHLTTLMITHNLEDAVKYGNRLIVMMAGKVVYAAAGTDKQNLSVSDLKNIFSEYGTIL